MRRTSAAARDRRRSALSRSTRSTRPLLFPAQRRAAQRRPDVKAAKATAAARAGSSRDLPRPVTWLLWLGVAALASVLVGFAMGLARPRTREQVGEGL